MSRVERIQEMHETRAKALKTAEMLLAAIANEEIELAPEISGLWGKKEIRAAQLASELNNTNGSENDTHSTR